MVLAATPQACFINFFIRTGAHGKKLPVKAKRAPSKRKKAPSKKKFLLGDILLGGVYKSKFLGKKLPVFFFFFFVLGGILLGAKSSQ